VVACLLLDPRVVGSNQAEDDRFLRAIKIRSATSFGGEVKPSVPCRKMYGMLKNPTSMKKTLHRQNSAIISSQVSPASLLGVSTGNSQRAVVDKSGIIRNQMETHSRSNMVSVQGSPWAPAP
jgi:hypothetical protein